MTNHVIEKKWNQTKGEVMEGQVLAADNFVHLHLHTDYSLMDGCQKSSDLFTRLKELGMNRVAITNHGSTINMYKIISDGAKQGIQVIPGCEFYVCWDYPATIKDDEHKETYHLVLLAKNQIGYSNLMKLSSRSQIEGKYYKPRIDRKMIEEHSEGLICLSACLAGYLGKKLGKENLPTESVKQTIDWFEEIFGDDFYLEVQSHADLPEQAIANQKIFEISNERHIPVVATCDAHYARPEHFEGWQSLMLLQTNFNFGNDVTNDYYVKSATEMNALFPNNPEVIKNSSIIADKCEPIKFDTSIKYPPFDTGDKTPGQYLYDMCIDDLNNKVSRGKINAKLRSQYEDRINFECKVLDEKNFTSYILTVADFISWAKSQGISVGPGRGSAAGSLVGYLTGITKVDPLRFGTIFER